MSQAVNKIQKQVLGTPDTLLLTTEERIEFIARLIADRIAEDEQNDFVLLKEIRNPHESGRAA